MRISGKIFLALTGMLFIAGPAFAQAAEEATGGSPWKVVAAVIAMAIASACGAFSQSRAGAAALEGIGRNPGAANSLFTPMLLVLALIESLVLFTFIIVFLIIG